MKAVKILFFLQISLAILAQDRPTVGLTLSGGGAKGYAHVSVLRELEDAKVKIDYISGTSMGAIIGSLYAAGYTVDEIENLIYKTDFSSLLLNGKDRRLKPLFDKTYNERYVLDLPIDDKFRIKLPNALSKGDKAYLFISQLLNNQHDITDFSQLQIPFVCVATDLESGEETVFENGFLPKAVMASASLPSILNPIEINGKKYVDGGLVNNMPAKILKDKGMDIVIGVNLGQGLRSLDDINGIQDVFEQISNYSISKGVEEQLKYTDIVLNPSLKNFGVTSFAEKDSIFEKGRIEAKKFRPKFDSIAKLQNYAYIPTSKQERGSDFCIHDINIKGKDKFNSDYVLGKLGIYGNEQVNSNKITTGIQRLYSTGNYKFIDYQIVKKDEYHNLNFNLEENDSKLIARLGLHYDDVFKTSLLLNLTHKQFIFNNTSASFDLIIGDKPRYFFKLFSDNGAKPSFGLNSSFMKMPISYSPNNSYLGFTNYNLQWYNNTFYIQSTLKDKYAIGVGLDHDYIKAKSIINSNTSGNLENSYYLAPMAYITADTKDNPNFPTEGLYLYGKGKYLWLSNQINFRRSLHINTKLSYSFKITKNLSYTQKIGFSTSIDNNTVVFNNMIGGVNQQNMLNFDTFYGYEFASLNGEHKMKLSNMIQYQIFKNNYIQLHGNIANLEREITKIKFFDYAYTGMALAYGYDSPIGPLQVMYSYSPQIQEHIVNFSLGYWF